MTAPAPRKRVALKKAWVRVWYAPPNAVMSPRPMNMYPSWEMVEYASTRFMSYWAMPIEAATRAVMPPIHATVSRAWPPEALFMRKSGMVRAIR